MQSSTWSRAQPPLLEHFTATAATASTTTSDGPASQLLPPAQPADPQADSPFFNRLPSEIRRMIYVEVWRTYGSDGYEGGDDANGGNAAGNADDDRHPYPRSTKRGGLSPHITAALAPTKSWLMTPLPGHASATTGNGNSSSSSSRSDGGTDLQQRPPSQQSSPPWTRQIRGFTSAPCFLAVDDDDNDNDYEGSKNRKGSEPRRPPEADDIRPQRLAAAHMADLDAVAASNSNGPGGTGSDGTDTPAARRPYPSSSTWRARWNSPWLGHWACEEYFSGAARTSFGSDSGSLEATATTSVDAAQSQSHRRHRSPLCRPYLPILLTCRRAYVEGIDLLYSALTFQFTEMATAEGFLERWPCVASVRLVVHLSTSLLDFYKRADGEDQGIITAGEAAGADLPPGPGAMTIGTFPRHDDERDRGIDVIGPGGSRSAGGTVVNARHNAWQRLCAGLGPDRLPNLRRLHVWVEAHDLRGWHKAAAETRLFAKLLEAGVAGSRRGSGAAADGDAKEAGVESARRRLTPDNFVLYLPTLPADAKTHGLPGCYLGEEETSEESIRNLEEPLPCTIVRTERPDYWDVHLNMRPVFVNRRMSIGSRVAALRRAGFL